MLSSLLADNSDAIAWTDSTASGNDGQVAFANIPSGYTYTLTETEAPKNYNKVDPITVTVKYGKLTADSTAEGGANITNGKLEDPSKQTYTDVTITKTWQKPAGEATPDSIIVTLKQDGTAMTEYTDFEIQKSDCTIDEMEFGPIPLRTCLTASLMAVLTSTPWKRRPWTAGTPLTVMTA